MNLSNIIEISHVPWSIFISSLSIVGAFVFHFMKGFVNLPDNIKVSLHIIIALGLARAFIQLLTLFPTVTEALDTWFGCNTQNPIRIFFHFSTLMCLCISVLDRYFSYAFSTSYESKTSIVFFFVVLIPINVAGITVFFTRDLLVYEEKGASVGSFVKKYMFVGFLCGEPLILLFLSFVCHVMRKWNKAVSVEEGVSDTRVIARRNVYVLKYLKKFLVLLSMPLLSLVLLIFATLLTGFLFAKETIIVFDMITIIFPLIETVGVYYYFGFCYSYWKEDDKNKRTIKISKNLNSWLFKKMSSKVKPQPAPKTPTPKAPTPKQPLRKEKESISLEVLSVTSLEVQHSP